MMGKIYFTDGEKRYLKRLSDRCGESAKEHRKKALFLRN